MEGEPAMGYFLYCNTIVVLDSSSLKQVGAELCQAQLKLVYYGLKYPTNKIKMALLNPIHHFSLKMTIKILLKRL